MEAVFLTLLNRSISAGWLVLAVVILRFLLKKAPKWAACLLWAVVAVRLLCPFSLKSPLSLIPSPETLSPYTMQFSQNPELDSGIPALDCVLNPTFQKAFTPSPYASVNPLHIWIFFCSVLWAAGVVILLLCACVSFLGIRRKVRESIPFRDHIRLCDAVSSPFILGIIRPRIYLPADMDEEALEPVLAHEQAHLKRLDHWWKPLACLLLTVYWFHPLMWAACILFCRDIELACDEKVIREMNLEEKKAYSHALVSCSRQQKRIVACPLAFGEIGVKQRINRILRYQKPAAWLLIFAAAACLATAVCFLTDPEDDVFSIRIVIPAGSEQEFHYSEQEISPAGKSITLSCGDGLGDTEILLEPTEEKGTTHGPAYLTPGMPVKMEMASERDAWFRIGVAVSNPTEEPLTVSVEIKGVQVRIAGHDAGPLPEAAGLAAGGQEPDHHSPGAVADPSGADTDAGSAQTEETAAAFALEQAVRTAVLEHNASSRTDCDLVCCDFVLLGTENRTAASNAAVTVYGWALYQEYNLSETGIEDTGGSHLPVALTFEINENEYHLKDYWEPKEGSYFVPDIRSRFPAELAADGIDSQKFILPQIQNCYRQAVEYGGLDADAIINRLLDAICEPSSSSVPRDYIDAHRLEYRELTFYGGCTLQYCFRRFRQGGETGLEGRIMALVCEELLQTKGKLPADAETSETGQFWYDTLYAHAPNLVEPYLP